MLSGSCIKQNRYENYSKIRIWYLSTYICWKDWKLKHLKFFVLFFMRVSRFQILMSEPLSFDASLLDWVGFELICGSTWNHILNLESPKLHLLCSYVGCFKLAVKHRLTKIEVRALGVLAHLNIVYYRPFPTSTKMGWENFSSCILVCTN